MDGLNKCELIQPNRQVFSMPIALQCQICNNFSIRPITNDTLGRKYVATSDGESRRPTCDSGHCGRHSSFQWYLSSLDKKLSCGSMLLNRPSKSRKWPTEFHIIQFGAMFYNCFIVLIQIFINKPFKGLKFGRAFII